MLTRSTKKVVVVAVAMGLAAAALTYYYMGRVVEAAAPTERVIVAKVNIPARARVTEDVLTYQSIPRGARHPESMSSMAPFIGKTTKQSLTAGEQVLTTKFFQERKETGLAYVVPEGKRAMSVRVDEFRAAGGLIATGDHIDFLGVCTVPNQDRSVSQSVEITKMVFALQNVEVLAVAQKVLGEEVASSVLDEIRPKDSTAAIAAKRQAAQQPQARTITLALSPKDAQTVVLLESNPACSIRLALRNSQDDKVISMPETTFNPLLPLAGQVQ
ncbi:MAG: Flp pilus assembly protein CpaB [Chloroflexota bacterium]